MENTSKILTVIILTYNHESSIAEALDSVLEQETTYPYEIWICEDCSTDVTLEICRDYANRYPDKIQLFAQPVNTYSDPSKVFHLISALKSVKAKYFCVLEGDDAWCDPKKIQTALDFLENNPEYITFAHDTLVNDSFYKTKKSLVHEILNIEIHNPVTFETAPLLHTSSRMYRSVVNFSEITNFSDIYVFYTFLDKGPLYYYDKIMSIYNSTGKGLWSRLSQKEGAKVDILLCGLLNKYFDYKYNEFFTRNAGNPISVKLLRKLLGKERAWEIWIRYKEFETRKILRKLFSKS